MGYTTTHCSDCHSKFNPNKNPATKGLASLGGFGFGGALGTKFGLAGGILGASVAWMAAIPAAIFGLLVGLLFDSKVVRCPQCDKVQLC